MVPRLLQFGSFTLATYGVLVAIGVIVGLRLAAHLGERENLDGNRIFNLGILVTLAGLVGAKVLFVALDWRYYAAHPGDIFSVSMLQTGGVFSGGLVAALAAAAIYIRKHRLPVLKTCDVFAPALAIGHAIGRLGCFAAGCCYGKPTTHFWGITFRDPVAFELSGTPLGTALQPTQLFESAVELANFFVLYRMAVKKHFDGQVIGTYLLLYGTARFFLEFLRGDPGRGEIFGGALSGTQLIAIGMVIAGGLLWARILRAKNRLQPSKC